MSLTRFAGQHAFIFVLMSSALLAILHRAIEASIV